MTSRYQLKILLSSFGYIMQESVESQLPHGFVDLAKELPDLLLTPRYATSSNFTGSPMKGYEGKRIVASIQVAQAIQKVSISLAAKGYKLVVYDAYRPQKAVDYFCEWSRQPEDNLTKQLYYPNKPKEQLISLDYLAERCPHSRACAIDVSLLKKENSLRPADQLQVKEVTLENGQSILYLDDGTEFMGTHFDFFDESSHLDTPLVGKVAQQNRNILRQAMAEHGFLEYEKEWWHYKIIPQPYPQTYFDFSI